MSPVRHGKADDDPGHDALLIRPATTSDVDDFYQLARLAGAGFTSLPVNEELLAERLVASERAFSGLPGTLTLALEDRRSHRVVGCAAVKPGGKPRPSFLNFQIDDDDQALVLTEKYADMTEVGSLLLHPDYRAHGVGPWLARSRYLLIAGDPHRFGERIFSELRGQVNEDDRSPFYDGVCRRYFGCSFADADELCAHGLQADLNALLPKRPIPLATLGSDARNAMGKPHRAGRRALDYLLREGFRFEGVIDLLDGGPAVVARRGAIRTVRSTFTAPLRADRIDRQGRAQAYVSVGDGADFRCCRMAVTLAGGELVCPAESLALLAASEGTMARACLIEDDGKRLAAPAGTGSTIPGRRACVELDTASGKP